MNRIDVLILLFTYLHAQVLPLHFCNAVYSHHQQFTVNSKNITHALIISCKLSKLGPCPGPLRSNIALVQSLNIIWTGLGPCVAAALLFLFIKATPTLVGEAFIFYLRAFFATHRHSSETT